MGCLGRHGAILFLDVCIVIYWIEAADPFHAGLMAGHEAPDARFAVSRLNWLECMVKPMRDDAKRGGLVSGRLFDEVLLPTSRTNG